MLFHPFAHLLGHYYIGLLCPCLTINLLSVTQSCYSTIYLSHFVPKALLYYVAMSYLTINLTDNAAKVLFAIVILCYYSAMHLLVLLSPI